MTQHDKVDGEPMGTRVVPSGRDATAGLARLDRGEARSARPELPLIADRPLIPNRATRIPPTPCPSGKPRVTGVLPDDQSAAEEGHHCGLMPNPEEHRIVFHVKQGARAKPPPRFTSGSARAGVRRARQIPPHTELRAGAFRPLITPGPPAGGYSEPGANYMPHKESGEEQ